MRSLRASMLCITVAVAGDALAVEWTRLPRVLDPAPAGPIGGVFLDLDGITVQDDGRVLFTAEAGLSMAPGGTPVTASGLWSWSATDGVEARLGADTALDTSLVLDDPDLFQVLPNGRAVFVRVNESSARELIACESWATGCHVVATVGDPIPGSDRILAAFREARIASDGRVVWIATLEDPAQDEHHAVVTAGPSGDVTVIADDATPIPGEASGKRYRYFRRIYVGTDTILFVGGSVTETGSPYPYSPICQESLGRWTAAGGPTVPSQDALPSEPCAIPSGFAFSANLRGDAAFVRREARFGARSLWRCPRESSCQLFLAPGDPVPGLAGAEFSPFNTTFSSLRLDSAGRPAFVASFTEDGGVESEGVFVPRADGTPSLRLRRGDTAPYYSLAAAFYSFELLAIADSGRVVVDAGLDPPDVVGPPIRAFMVSDADGTVRNLAPAEGGFSPGQEIYWPVRRSDLAAADTALRELVFRVDYDSSSITTALYRETLPEVGSTLSALTVTAMLAAMGSTRRRRPSRGHAIA